MQTQSRYAHNADYNEQTTYFKTEVVYLCKILQVNVYHISEMLVSLLLNLTKYTIGITESFFSNLF